MVRVGNLGAYPEQPQNPDNTTGSGNTAEAKANEIQVFSYNEGYEKTIGYVAKNDGGYFDNLLDGDYTEMISQLTNLKNTYKSKLPQNLIDEIDNKIKDLKINDFSSKLVFNKSYSNKVDHQIRTMMSNKLKSITTENDCIKVEEYLISLIDDDAVYGNDLNNTRFALTEVRNRRHQINPNYNPLLDQSDA